MRHGYGQFKEATPEFLRFAKQFGATDVLLNTPNLPAPGGTLATQRSDQTQTQRGAGRLETLGPRKRAH